MAVEENKSPQSGIGGATGFDGQVMRRPYPVTLLVILGLIIVGFSLVRLIQSLEQWSYLAALRSFLPVYLVASAIGWICVSLAVIWGLWKGKRWAPNAVRVFCVAFLIYYWIDILLLTDPAGRSENMVIILCLQLVFLAWIFGMLASPATKRYFRRNL